MGLVAVGAGPVTYVLSSKDGAVLFRAGDSSSGTSEPAPFSGAPSIAHATLYESDSNGLLYAYTSLLSITTLPVASIGKAYAARILAVGGLPAYRWAPLGGSVPPGLALSTGGVLRGKPTVDDIYWLTARVTDSRQSEAVGHGPLAVQGRPTTPSSAFPRTCDAHQYVPTRLPKRG